MANQVLNTVVAKGLDIWVYQGDTTDFSVTFNNDDGSPNSLVGKSFKMQVRQKPGANKLAEYGTSPLTGLTITGPGNNILLFDGVIKQNINCAYDLQMTDGAGKITTWLFGGIVPTKEITTP